MNSKIQSAETTGNGRINSNGHLLESLSKSQIFKDYERAFSETTGQPVALRPVETWQLPLHGKARENPFCAMVAGKSRTCAGCLQVQEQLAQQAKGGVAIVTCPYGLCEMAAAVKVGEQTAGFLQTGQVMRQKPSEAQFKRVAAQLKEQDPNADLAKAKEAYFATPVISSRMAESLTVLLSIFAEHLALKGNQIVLQQQNSEPPLITKAKQYINEHIGEDLSLGQVAAAVHMSSFYFCKLFKKATGINFTDYVSRARIERAKNLLINANLRISEIAYEIGFQSLTHFNRMFKKIVGESPTEYREKLPAAIR